VQAPAFRTSFENESGWHRRRALRSSGRLPVNVAVVFRHPREHNLGKVGTLQSRAITIAPESSNTNASGESARSCNGRQSDSMKLQRGGADRRGTVRLLHRPVRSPSLARVRNRNASRLSPPSTLLAVLSAALIMAYMVQDRHVLV
jgi:hypothetical protein